VPLHPQPPLFNARTHVDTKFYDEEVYFHDGDQKVFNDGYRNYDPLFPDNKSNIYDGDRNYEGTKFENDDPNMDNSHTNSHEGIFFENDDPKIDDRNFYSGNEVLHDETKFFEEYFAKEIVNFQKKIDNIFSANDENLYADKIYSDEYDANKQYDGLNFFEAEKLQHKGKLYEGKHKFCDVDDKNKVYDRGRILNRKENIHNMFLKRKV